MRLFQNKTTPLLFSILLAACSHSTAATPSAELTPLQRGPLPFAQGDVDFMTGMIHHHAQAVEMAKWVPTHEATDALRRMAERIDVGQRDEIFIMQRWLRERNLPVPDTSTAHHNMAGMNHEMMTMPGMLSPEQMAQLDAARGVEFDRLFLTFMIQHHKGAITMVDRLFASQGAGQDEIAFRMAQDIYADQTTEIDRMQKMLDALPTASGEHRP